MTQATRPIPFTNIGAGVQFPIQELTDDGAITIPQGLVRLNKAGAIAATLAAPKADGLLLCVTSDTAQAHTLDLATTGINGGSADVGTYGGAIGDCVILFSEGGDWCQVANVNVTWA